MLCVGFFFCGIWPGLLLQCTATPILQELPMAAQPGFPFEVFLDLLKRSRGEVFAWMGHVIGAEDHLRKFPLKFVNGHGRKPGCYVKTRIDPLQQYVDFVRLKFEPRGIRIFRNSGNVMRTRRHLGHEKSPPQGLAYHFSVKVVVDTAFTVKGCSPHDHQDRPA